jgi:hypothetical protein
MLLKCDFNSQVKQLLRKHTFTIVSMIILTYSIAVAVVTALIMHQGVVGRIIIPAIRTNVQLPINYLEGLLAPADKLVIDIKHKHFLKIAHKRDEAVKINQLFSNKDGWVPAQLTYRNVKYRAKIRLKGTLNDHWQDDGFWSYKINMRDGQTLFGMDRFAIQHPRTRNYLNEWYFHKLLRYMGIIALRYDFVPVVVNGKEFPVFAIEEHFGKRLIENNDRREGPIFRLVQDQKLGRHVPSAVTFHQEQKLKQSEDNRKLMRRVRRLANGFLNGELITSEVFDLNVMANFVAINELLGYYHSLSLHNIRFYLNPITGLIEPAPIDNQVISDLAEVGMLGTSVFHANNRYSGQFQSLDWQTRLFSDAKFSRAYGAALQKISSKAWLDGFFKAVENESKEKISLLYRSYPYYKFQHKNLIYKNQEHIRGQLDPVQSVRAVAMDSSRTPGSKPADLSLSVRLANSHSLPIEVVAVGVENSNVRVQLKTPLFLPNRVKSCQGKTCLSQVRGAVIFSDELLNLTGDQFTKISKEPLQLILRVAGTNKTFTAPLYSKDEVDDVNPTIAALADFEFILIDEAERKITVKAGKWRVDKDILVPAGYSFDMVQDTALDLVDGASILSYSPLNFAGTPDAPINIGSTDRMSQGIAVIQASGHSSLEHVNFENLGARTKSGNRLSGSVTFFESDVSMKNVLFRRNRSEDALNLIRSEFQIDNVRFEEVFADALDADFSKGSIRNSQFLVVGNDGIDISGSQVTVHAIVMHTIGDKGISVGERSQLKGSNISITAAKIAIASKDSSNFDGRGIDIFDSDIGLASYQKKTEFGPSAISVLNIQLKNTMKATMLEPGSSIFVNEQPVGEDASKLYERIYGAK